MLLLSPGSKVWVYHEPVDLRKSYNSLCGYVEQELYKNARSGDGFVFINRNKTLAKVLWWDRTGWCLLLKKLSAGRFRISGRKDIKELEINNFRMFFDGI
jgi:transposase